LEQTDEFVADYDNSARQYGWYTPEVLFGLMHERIEPGQEILDMGIGTGLSAVPFSKAGLEVYGLDSSHKMLDRCAAKGIAAELKQHDISSVPIPYDDDSFDHVVASGVFHLIGELGDVFCEASRVMRRGGAFGFSLELLESDRISEGKLVSYGLLETRNETSGVIAYLHSHSLIEDLVSRAGLAIEKTLDYVAYRKTEWADERSFRAYVAYD
jgi:predicted TPR repeat methyltransferase